MTTQEPEHSTESGDSRLWTLASLNTGVCPGCGEVKFIGHGPLCTDCYLRSSPGEGADG